MIPSKFNPISAGLFWLSMTKGVWIPPPSRKQCNCWPKTMKLGTLLYLPKNYSCTKCGCYSLIYDVTMTSLMCLQQLYWRFCVCLWIKFYFVITTLPVFLFDFLECYNVVHYIVNEKWPNLSWKGQILGCKNHQNNQNFGSFQKCWHQQNILLNFNILIKDNPKYVFTPNNTNQN